VKSWFHYLRDDYWWKVVATPGDWYSGVWADEKKNWAVVFDDEGFPIGEERKIEIEGICEGRNEQEAAEIFNQECGPELDILSVRCIGKVELR
jgi:hypothetical protein